MNLPFATRPLPLPTHDAQHAIERLDVKGTHAVLDLGCGDGHHSHALDRKKPELLVNLDVSLEQLSCLAQRSAKGNQYSLVCADALASPFRAESFDRVVCSLVLYLLPLERALRELHRLLRPRGRAYLRVPMLALGRASKILTDRSGTRGRLYAASHVLSGVFYSVVGRQIRNPILGHDKWACYIPRHRFARAVLRAGFRIETIEIDYPRPRTPSIEAWLVKD